MLLPHAITGGAPLSFGGRRWWLRITYRVLLWAEESTGVDMLAASTDITRPSSRVIRALLWAALRQDGSEWTEQQVGRCLNLNNVFAIHRAVFDAWIASMPAPEKKQAKEGQPQPKVLGWVEAWAEATSQHGLGLSNDAWQDLTPRQLHALRKVQIESLQRMEYLAGVVASTTANYGFCRPRRPISPAAFMLHPPDPMDRGPLTGEQISAALAPVKAFFAQRKVS